MTLGLEMFQMTPVRLGIEGHRAAPMRSRERPAAESQVASAANLHTIEEKGNADTWINTHLYYISHLFVMVSSPSSMAMCSSSRLEAASSSSPSILCPSVTRSASTTTSSDLVSGPRSLSSPLASALSPTIDRKRTPFRQDKGLAACFDRNLPFIQHVEEVDNDDLAVKAPT